MELENNVEKNDITLKKYVNNYTIFDNTIYNITTDYI